MGISAVDAVAQLDMSQALAVKVVKDQLQSQEQLAAALVQPTVVYDANGKAHAAPPQSSFDVQM